MKDAKVEAVQFQSLLMNRMRRPTVLATMQAPTGLCNSSSRILRSFHATTQDPLVLSSRVPGGRFLSDAAQETAPDGNPRDGDRPLESMPALDPSALQEMGGHANLLKVLRGMRERYGDIVRADGIGGARSVYLFHPADIRTVFRREGPFPVGGAALVWPFARACAETGTTLVSCLAGPEWRRLRSALQRNLSASSDADSYLPLINRAARAALYGLSGHENAMGTFCTKAAAEMIATVLFGRPLGVLDGTASPEDHDFVRRVALVSELGQRFLWRNPDEVSRDEWEPLPEAMRLVMERGAHHLRRALREMTNVAATPRVEPYLARLVGRAELAETEIVHSIVGLLHAGTDTTASALMWLLCNIAGSPGSQERLHEEVRTVVEGGADIARRHLNAMPYLKAVLRESFRVTPTVPGTIRVLPDDVSLRGYRIPAGTLLFLFAHPSATDPAVFAEPLEFRPERYALDEPRPSCPRGDPTHLHMPFSRGARMCIGARLAELELSAFVSHLVLRYRIAIAPGSAPIQAASMLTVRPSPMPRFVVEPRDP